MVDSKLCQDIDFLVVEDQPHMNELVQMVVTALGARSVTRVDSGRQALAAIRQAVPDVLITDYMMNDVDGVTLVQELRAMPAPASAVHVIMVTGRHDAEAERAALAAGVDVFITKPIWTRRLFEALEAYVAARRQSAHAPS